MERQFTKTNDPFSLFVTDSFGNLFDSSSLEHYFKAAFSEKIIGCDALIVDFKIVFWHLLHANGETSFLVEGKYKCSVPGYVIACKHLLDGSVWFVTADGQIFLLPKDSDQIESKQKIIGGILTASLRVDDKNLTALFAVNRVLKMYSLNENRPMLTYELNEHIEKCDLFSSFFLIYSKNATKVTFFERESMKLLCTIYSAAHFVFVRHAVVGDKIVLLTRHLLEATSSVTFLSSSNWQQQEWCTFMCVIEDVSILRNYCRFLVTGKGIEYYCFCPEVPDIAKQQKIIVFGLFTRRLAEIENLALLDASPNFKALILGYELLDKKQFKEAVYCFLLPHVIPNWQEEIYDYLLKNKQFCFAASFAQFYRLTESTLGLIQTNRFCLALSDLNIDWNFAIKELASCDADIYFFISLDQMIKLNDFLLTKNITLKERDWCYRQLSLASSSRKMNFSINEVFFEQQKLQNLEFKHADQKLKNNVEAQHVDFLSEQEPIENLLLNDTDKIENDLSIEKKPKKIKSSKKRKRNKPKPSVTSPGKMVTRFSEASPIGKGKNRF